MVKLFSVFLTALTLISSACAVTIYIPSQYSTIQAGIDASVNGDTVLVADGTYTGTGNRNLDFGGRAIVLRSESGPETCIIDCDSLDRGFYFHSGEDRNSIVSGFTIKNGYSIDGGGIYCSNSSPVIEFCILTMNVAILGGAFHITYGNPIINGCTIYKNFNYTNGIAGALYSNYSSLTLKNSIIAENFRREALG